MGSGYSGNGCNQPNSYSCLIRMPTHQRPLRQWSLVIADDPSVRSTKLSRAQFLHLAATTNSQHCSLTACRPVTYIRRVSNPALPFGLALATGGCRSSYHFLHTNAVTEWSHSFPIHSHTTISNLGWAKQFSLLQYVQTDSWG